MFVNITVTSTGSTYDWPGVRTIVFDLALGHPPRRVPLIIMNYNSRLKVPCKLTIGRKKMAIKIIIIIEKKNVINVLDWI